MTNQNQWARLTNARDELAERIADAERHTPGGVLTEAERAVILRSVARAHGVAQAEVEVAND